MVLNVTLFTYSLFCASFRINCLDFPFSNTSNTSCITVLFVGETDAPESLPVNHWK